MNRSVAWMALLACALVLAGCDDGRKRPPPAMIQVAHVAPSYGTIEFIRVEARETSLEPRSATSRIVDEDTYRFSIDILPPGTNTPQRVLSFTQPVLNGTDYTFVFTEIGGQLDRMVIESPAFSQTSSVSQVLAAHAAPGVPQLSVYVEPPGTDLSAATPVATLGFTQHTEPRTRAAGEYEVTLTQPGNPTDVVLKSFSFELRDGQSNLFVIASEAGFGLAEVGVLLVREDSLSLLHTGLGAGVRVINAIADRAPRDVYLEDDFDTPILSGIEFGEASAYADVAFGENVLTYTPGGNPGVIELEDTRQTARGRLHTVLLTGQPGDVDSSFAVDDRREFVLTSRIRFINGANDFELLNVFLTPADQEQTGVFPTTSLPVGGISNRIGVAPGDYNLRLRVAGEAETVLAGPIPITLDERGVYEVLFVDGTANDAVEIVLLEGFE